MPKGIPRKRVPKWGWVVNQGQHATAQSKAIDYHYFILELERRWNADRFKRLCGFLKATPGELASLIGIPHNLLSAYLKQNAFPQTACILLAMLENYVMGDINPDPIEGEIVPTSMIAGGATEDTSDG